MAQFHVRLWDTDEIKYTTSNLPTARKYARGLGHTGEDHPKLTRYPPVAYVANEAGECVYNPRFGKLVRGVVAGLIDAQPSSHF